jgi:hypothetical protein
LLSLGHFLISNCSQVQLQPSHDGNR